MKGLIMLDGLEEINWSKLHHAYGEAGDVPKLIRQLLSKDNATVNNAVYELCGNIWHQGTVYEASAYAVPFLVELLKSSVVSEQTKISLATLLANLADSYDDIDGRYALATRNAVEKELRLLLSYLSCNVPIVRGGVAGAISHYPQYISETLPLLKKLLK